MKKTLVVLLVALFAMSFVFAGGSSESASSSGERQHKFCLIVTGGTLGDQANNDAIWAGFTSFCNENGFESTAIELPEVADIDRTVREMASDGYDFIGFNSSDAADMMDDLCPDFPSVRFVMYNGTNNNGYDNLTNVSVDVAGAGFLTSIYGCLMNEYLGGQRKVGYIGGVRNPNLERVRYSMQAAAELIGGECIAAYVGSFSDAAKGKEIAQQMHSNGANVIQAWAGGANKGIYEAAETAGEGHLSIGAANGQYHMSSTIWASLNTQCDKIFYELCSQFVEGTIKGGFFESSVLNGMVDCVPAPDERAGKIPASILEEVDKYRQMLKSGEIFAPTTEAEYNDFAAKFLSK